MAIRYDLIIIGTGAGGGTLAFALAQTGKQILLLDRGDYIPQEPENWCVKAMHLQSRYQTDQRWYDIRQRKYFKPALYHRIGGNTKVYGAALFRMRHQDFQSREYEDGYSPAWPIGYNEFESYYSEAETLFQVHGRRGEDPTEPFASQDFPFAAIAHEPKIQAIATRLAATGLHPFSLPMGINQGAAGNCIRCQTCDGYPCKLNAKADAQVCCIDPALKYENVTLKTKVDVQRLITNRSGDLVVGIEVLEGGQKNIYSSDRVVVACGAINSAALLLRSRNTTHPHGLANSSGMVGRNLMKHNVSKIYAVDWTCNDTVFQKTFGINDYYQPNGQTNKPLGHMHLMGKHTWEMMQSDFPTWIPNAVIKEIAKRSVDFWVQSEDFPDVNNRVTIRSDGQVNVSYRPNHLKNHKQLLKALKRHLHQAGFPVVFSAPVGLKIMNHQMGTCRFGGDPSDSVLNLDCRCHDVDNLYVVDSSFFPSSGAINPTLTIVANALRVADLFKRDWANGKTTYIDHQQPEIDEPTERAA